MEPKRPQLSLDELKQLKWLLGGTLTLFAIGMVGYIDVNAWIFGTVAGAGVLVCLVEPALPARVPVLFHRFAFPIIVAVFLVDLWATGELLPAVVRLDLFLLLYRGITYRQRRDDLQVLILGLFLIVIAGVITVSFAFAGQLLLFTAVSLIFLLTVTIVDATEAKVAPQPPGTLPEWAAHVKWGRLARRVRKVLDWRLALLGGLLFVGVVAISAVLFMAIPRFQIGDSLFLDRLVARRAKTGFNDTIRFGEITQIAQDDSVAMNVDVSDPSHIPTLPYWRMLVLDEYRDQTFRLSPAMRLQKFSRLRGDQGLSGTSRETGAPVWTFYLEAGTSRFLPLLGRFGFVRYRETQYYQVSEELGVIALRDEPATMLAYRVEGMVDSDRWPDARFGAALKAHAPINIDVPLFESMHLSGGDRDVLTAIDRSISAGQKLDAEAFGRAAGVWLVSHHGYSLSPSIPGGSGDPLIRWINSSESGHCELFAGGFVLLARAAGFPARVVTGFKGGTWNAYSNNFTIRNSDAHAWAEIWDSKSQSWVREDPLQQTAAVSSSATVGSGSTLIDRSWLARLNSIRVFWYRSIVNFDQNTQVETAKAVRDAAASSGVRIRDWVGSFIKRAKAWSVAPWNARRWKQLAGALGAAAVLVWFLFSAGKLASRLSARRQGIDPTRAEASRWLLRLSDSDDPVVHALRRIRFGRKERWPSPESTFKEARRASRRSREGV